ncbi:MAG: YtxH domain-containing protein [Gloeomargarita sp. SKYG116]|nr:YtxH domain-containing protein [Gloeomargarita sp. SKYG116]MCS7293021.1 YtxH domain-containing protein [Gloeomargarita sp. SKYB120]MDW8178586.1 YtxH domain-containing protein [Gloeomargarita sp. SKYBB_i_bin120]MDW8400212.1 YtxH domain-containing protein [Gloeomargarita sp. SKYGB_i_bin116]
MSRNPTGAFLGGLVIGGVTGLVAGMVLAPRSGQETRRLLRKAAAALPELTADVSGNLQLQAQRWTAVLQQQWQDHWIRFQLAVQAGWEAGRQEHQRQQNRG